MKGRIMALLNSGAAVNILSSKTVDLLGLESYQDNTSDYRLWDTNGGWIKVLGTTDNNITVGRHPMKGSPH